MVRSKKGSRGGGAGKSNGRGQGRRGCGGGRGGGGGDGGRRHDEDDDGADFIPFSGASKSASHPQGFSLQAEALNTQRHEPSRLSNLRLRDAKVSFVSASTLPPPEPETPGPETAMECMSLKESDGDLGMSGIMDSSEQGGNTPEAEDEEGSHESKEQDAQDEFIIDTEGNQSIETNLPPPQIRSSSPTPSNSSEEVILFRGRDNNGQFFGSLPSAEPKPSKTTSLRTTINDDVAIYTKDKQPAVETSLATDMLHLSSQAKGKGKEKGHLPEAPSTDRVDFQSKLSDSLDTPPLTSRKSRNSGGRNRKIRSVEDEMMNDYITNLEEQGLDVLGLGNGRELGDNDNDIFQQRDSSPDSGMELLEENLDPSDFLDQDTLEVLDEVSGPIDAVLSRRDAKSGLQYLVAWSEQMSDKSGWVPAAATALLTPQALDLIGKFEANEKLVTESLDGDADDSDSADDDLTESTDSEDDDMDLIQRQFDNLNDEKMARLLAKQFEFGFDSSELALFDGLNEPSGGSSSTARNRKRDQFQRREKVSRSPQSGFPSATRLADAYDGFDVMDFERPSLNKKPKGRKGRLPFDVSDPELEASMQSAWENDRVKKKQRKEDREHRRALGVLGIHPDKPDLSMKYKEGMGIMAIKEEIRLFLIGKNTTLALPPMDKKDRIVVHEIANAFNLKSKSVGAERKRFPVLYRTHRTSAYNENVFTSVERRISRRFFPRMDVKGKNPMAKTSSGFRGTAGGYKDGDVVGGSAPELGVENRGRAMMEKMGWSSGTALGALNNKGILQPVSHVVKTTKAGLG
ncbi:hypothetical protein VE02_00477 [Pseudogymnoascus sp. 03VT05]|nr:hypothetical protein VE02_00477 [Pseudogymnoascus sp. 03VT05]